MTKITEISFSKSEKYVVVTFWKQVHWISSENGQTISIFSWLMHDYIKGALWCPNDKAILFLLLSRVDDFEIGRKKWISSRKIDAIQYGRIGISPIQSVSAYWGEGKHERGFVVIGDCFGQLIRLFME